MNVLRIHPLEPILARDGRPFDKTPGIRAHSLGEVPPSVVAGTVRTLLRKLGADPADANPFHPNEMKKLARTMVRGPLIEWEGEVYYPMPQDVVFYEEAVGGTSGDSGAAGIMSASQLKAGCLRPRLLPQGQGFLGTGKDGEHESLWPPVQAEERKVAKDRPAYLSAAWMERWLCDCLPEAEWSEALRQWSKGKNSPGQQAGKQERAPLMSPFVRDERTHTEIDKNTYTAKEQALFTTHSLVFPEGVGLLAAIEMDESGIRAWPGGFPAIHSMGGERRLASFQEIEDRQPWTCPHALAAALDGAAYVRMVLATPAYFAKGWRPGWLDEQLQTTDTFSNEVQLQLVWACVSRWQPISGWSYSRGEQGEKAVRRMVPAGSVYFFKVIKGNPRQLAEKKWLTSVSDANRRKSSFDDEDGFGLALWGKWQPREE
ncbi:type III-B CRISPR module-associated protein Cmr3 [Paenibacillus popilliae]|uniref:CRISPR-associated protein n=1 Tax=Paenibacillus popilliae ATCC 14706 TaxID=1212764 RepID=M9LZU6_PAEPP|nr:type III-B CRISPR module-associated protein Cmr3 [Paenibacillus popilliae]GAC41919.1 hypothetical protein PPOP_1276 [Paenibacillus popilliae ATCC 14706]